MVFDILNFIVVAGPKVDDEDEDHNDQQLMINSKYPLVSCVSSTREDWDAIEKLLLKK